MIGALVLKMLAIFYVQSRSPHPELSRIDTAFK